MHPFFTPIPAMSWFVTNTIATLLLPPLSLLLLLALGLFLLYRRHKLAWPLTIASFLLLWLAATPYVADSGMRLLEARTAPLGNQDADAIVILGGGSYFHAPEYENQDTVSQQTLTRLRYGARLQRRTGKPILVTGGSPLGNRTSEAQQMKVALEQDFSVPVRWTENDSSNTYENAHYSFRILQQAGIKKIYVVTHAWHMPRSADIFRRAGFEVVEAPTAFTMRHKYNLLAFLPRADSLRDSSTVVHELIGLLWYQVRSIISN